MRHVESDKESASATETSRQHQATKEPLADEIVVARTAWENEQTMATATRYITLLEVARQIQ